MVEAACHSSAFPPASSLLHCFPLQALTDAIRPPALRSKTHGSSYSCALLSHARALSFSLYAAPWTFFPPIHFPNGRSRWWDTDIKSITPSGKSTSKTLDRRLVLQQWWVRCMFQRKVRVVAETAGAFGLGCARGCSILLRTASSVIYYGAACKLAAWKGSAK